MPLLVVFPYSCSRCCCQADADVVKMLLLSFWLLWQLLEQLL
jgi:hypothetical protein